MIDSSEALRPPVTPTPRTSPWLFVFAVPPLVVIAAAAALTVLGAFGRNPFWPRQTVTMAEAAALRDPATVAWMIESGVDPNAPMYVRRGVFDRQDHTVTPAEAAIIADRIEVLETLIARGVRSDAGIVRRWFCLAVAADSEDTIEFLRGVYPEWTGGECGVEGPVQAR